jgi:hypothetical protein
MKELRMTENKLRHKTVAVAVLYDPVYGFLLWNNKRWGGYAFPMKHMEDGDDPVQTALQAVCDRDFPLDLSDASAGALEEAGWFGFSEGVKEDTYYDYHVAEVSPGQTLAPADLDPDLRFFTYDQLQAAANVTESTRAIATSLVDNQEVVVAVISRERDGQLEFLLVHKSDRGYFFPTIRRKTHGPLEDLAIQAVRFDTSYEGRVQASYCSEGPHQRPGTRYGASNRRYRFYLCQVTFPDVDLCQTGNALEQSLDALEAVKVTANQPFGERDYWSWFTTDEMKQRPDLSPDVAAVLQVAIACAEQRER